MAVSATVISSRSNPRVKQLRAAFAGNDRLSGGLVAIEGDHLLEEAFRSKVRLQTIFLNEHREAPRALSPSVEVVRLTSDVFASAVETRSPQGIAALIQPHVYSLAEILQQIPLLVIAVELQDPGNLGTIIRSAEAFGAAGVLTTTNTVSPWNQKALRASAGSIFRVPVLQASQDEIVNLQSAYGIRIFAAVSEVSEGVLAANAVDLRQPSAIMIGNEGAGLAPEWLAISTARITIPCPGPVESLNAAIAASLLLYEASRQRSSTTSLVTETIPGPLRRRPTGAAR